ncbi:GIY-YIG nuclease family protein OS=Stutzerimonas stutzeri OX=316 GN=G7024_23870 PE=4 SV=1 [Stutzerimonas stutzeri]
MRLFLVDGTPNGLLTAEIMNWTGHVLTGPRSKLAELVQRPECARTGVYFLVGPDLDDSLRTRVYIGESDDVAQRLKQHNRPEEQGGKDFWERVCLITSKDQNLTKAHASTWKAN